jgi:hypothetical protein
VSRARQRAEQSRDRAEQANAIGNDDFMSASRMLTAGQRMADRDPSQAVGQFLDAEAGFERARVTAASAANTRPTTPQGGASPPTTPGGGAAKPVIPTEVPSGPTPGTPSKPVETPSKPTPVPTPAPTPVPTAPDTSADQKLVEATVRRYHSARSSLDLAQVQQVYPGVPANRERDTLRSIERACETFSEQPTQISVVSVSAQEAIVRSRAQTSCKQKAGGRDVQSPPFEVFITLRKTGGSWQIAQVNRPDRAR